MVSMNTTLMDSALPWAGNTWAPESIREKHHGHLMLAVAHVFLALWAWLVNGTQVVNLLQDVRLRGQPASALMVSISVGELLVAGILCPLYTDSLVRGPWRHGLFVCSMYELLFYLQVCVSSLAVLVFNVERFYFMAAPRLLLSSSRRRHTIAVLTSLPWLLGLVVVVPLFTQGTQASMEHVPGLHHRTCVVQWDRTLHIVSVFVAFLAPSFLMLLTAVTVLLLYVLFAIRAPEPTSVESATPALPSDRQWTHIDGGNLNGGSHGRRRRTRHFSGLQELDNKLKKECVLSVCVSTFLSVGLQFPFFTLLLLQEFCQQPPQQPPSAFSSLPESSSYSVSSQCQFSDTAWATCMMLTMAKPGLLPLVWLVYSDIRAGFSPRVCGLCWWACWRWRRLCWSPSSSSSRARGEGPRDDCGESEACCSHSQPSLASQMTIV